MSTPATVTDLREMQARYPANAHFVAACERAIAALEPNGHRHPCPEDGCPGVGCFTTLEGCGDGTREGFCPMEVRRGEACPDLAPRP